LKFTIDNFWAFESLFDCKHENIHMQWVLDVNIEVCHLAFKVFSQHIWVVHWDLETMVVYFVIEDVFVVVESLVKNQCIGGAFLPCFCNFLLHSNFRFIRFLY
jgi:hypothetical protein